MPFMRKEDLRRKKNKNPRDFVPGGFKTASADFFIRKER